MPKTPIAVIDSFASDYVAGSQISEHAHESHQIIFAVQGVMHVTTAKALWVVPPARALWMPKGVLHTIHCVNALKLRTVYLSAADAQCPDAVQVFSVSGLMKEVILKLTEDMCSPLLQSLSQILMSELSQAPSMALLLPIPTNDRIARITQTLIEKPADNTTLAQWADIIGYSQRSLSRHIQEQTGMSFRDYKRQARILSAFEYLSAGDSVTSAAYKVGFESLSAFTQSFKAITGKTPSQLFIR